MQVFCIVDILYLVVWVFLAHGMDVLSEHFAERCGNDDLDIGAKGEKQEDKFVGVSRIG